MKRWDHIRLGSRTDTGHRETDVNGRTNTTEEKFGLQENLAISNGNNLQNALEYISHGGKRADISRNVSGHITTLGLNDGESSQGSTTEFVAHLGSTFEETRVEVEDITRVGFTTRRTTEKEGHLTVSDGLL